MRQAMAFAEVGDDVYGEDPTVNKLEALAAEKLGKEAGLFVTSGTQGNLIAALVHARRGDEAILSTDSHVYQWEVGGISSIGGIFPRTVPNDAGGRMRPEDVEAAVRDDDHHLGHSRLLLVENSFGGCGGSVLEPSYYKRLRKIADRHKLAMHMDGARIFNAAVALGLPAAELVSDIDTVTFCLSKGLCAPVGSVLCGPAPFIEEARRVRKSLGGGMRQVGILAAAGVIALDSMIDRLAEDHRRAALLAEKLSQLESIRVDRDAVQTNIVHFALTAEAVVDADELCRQLRDEHQIGLSQYPGVGLRAVTHYWIDDAAVDKLASAIASILSA
jgi:threonine aldolase